MAPRRAAFFFFVETAIGWNALLPIIMGLPQRTDLAQSIIAVSCPVTVDYESWRFTSKASQNVFRGLYAPIDKAMALPWDIFVVSMWSQFANLSPHQHIVSVPHGSGFGNGAYTLEMYARSTLYCGLSPAEAGYIADQTGAPPPADRFIATGTPRNDRFAAFLAAPMAARAEKKNQLKENLGLARDKPLLLVTSHWTPDGILRTFGGGILDALAPLAGSCEIVQISHPNIWDDLQYDTWDPNTERPGQEGFSSAWIRAALDARHAAGKAKVFYDLESPELLMAADLLIGDYSSIVIEFSMFDRPILLYDVPERFFDSNVHDLYVGASLCFRRADDVERLARYALSNPSHQRDGRRRLSAHFNYNIGGATDAIVDVIAGLPVGKPPESD